MANRRNSHFQHGTGAFKCETCGRMTRTTHQPSDTRTCFECWELAGYQNSIWDGEKAEDIIDTVNALLTTIVERGGDVAAVRADMPDLFAAIAKVQDRLVEETSPVNEKTSCTTENTAIEFTHTREQENTMQTNTTNVVATVAPVLVTTKRPRSAAQVAAFAKLQADKAAKRAANQPQVVTVVPVAAPVAPAPVAKELKGRAASGHRATFNDTDFLVIVADENPKRPGTHAERWFDMTMRVAASDNPTVGAAKKAGVPTADLLWNLKHGFLVVLPA